MDIASLSTALSMSKLNNEIGMLMLVKIMEQSASPHLGRNIDISL